ncbi:putative NAD/FAD-binding protein [Rhizobium sp. SG_E_25_P2]|uniref:NAD(P)/FAD-dependent oxidoreductase n=1 Tax=Rhizobium sp. SG_E_25_P2 TaxID=2879942 RepID=UPI0024755799|nr:NAD(P)/FAD-dependent oxidoreductase [Rhizobium sp. SG_E_25_P2]MDH6265098.1 putative NAD/FAD-binding protein [Rhizobium sp. SG_E_25_P2]
MAFMERRLGERPLDIAVIGTGISGLSAAWLLSQRHSVTVYEAADRVGGHSNTVEFDHEGQRVAVDTGFIVYNERTYPNLTALFKALDAPNVETDMSFAVSMNGGAFEYSGSDAFRLFAQPSNAFKPRYWRMLSDILRFYRNAPRDLPEMGDITLDAYLERNGYSRSFREDHLYPMAAAIWSTPALDVGDYPAASFVRFCSNHGLLDVVNRPKWRTVQGGSREYVQRLSARFADRILTSTPVASIKRLGGAVEIRDAHGGVRRFDDVVVATHADQALSMLADPTEDERRLLGAFRYSRNEAVLHSDPNLMPKRRFAWSAWNYLSDTRDGQRSLSVTYWMNKLQPLGDAPPTFVTLNPCRDPRSGSVHVRQTYEHPIFDVGTQRAQQELWSLQGHGNTWFCGAHFGAGFHEDGLQAGLAVAEDLGGLRRPWQVQAESARIVRRPLSLPIRTEAMA